MSAPLSPTGFKSIVPLSIHSSSSEATLPAWRCPSWPFSWGALLASLLVLWSGAPAARAQGTPPGCAGSAIGISLFGSSSDVHVGDTLFYSASIYNGIAGNPISCDASNIVASITTPDGVVHPITLTRTYLSHAQSDFYNSVVSYVVRAQDIRPDGTVRATAQVTAKILQNDIPSDGGAVQGVNTQVVQPCINIVVQCVGSVGENGAITYSGSVSNCGNDTLFGVTVTNNVNGGQFPVTLATNRLAPGQVLTFSGSWIPTNPCGPSTATFVTRGTDLLTFTPQTVTSSASTTCQNTLTPAIKVTVNCPTTPARPGGSLFWSGSISNAGNVTVTNVVVVHDHPVANTIVYTRATLAPGENFVFGGSYPAPTNCSVANTLNATASSRCGVGVSSVASATCPILTTPQILVTASCPAAPVTPGGSMVHSGTVRNVGDTTLNNIVVVRDFPAPNTTVFTLASLAPGASANFTSTLTVPANACFVTTTFSGRGTDVCAPITVTNNVSTTCLITTAPAVVVTLTCPATPVATGGLITYTGTVRNSGNVILNNVTVVNNQSVPSTVLTVASLAPGVTTNFTASFTAPADACSVSSTVTASGSDNCTGAVVNNSASATCALTTSPAIRVAVNCPTTPASPGGSFFWSGSISNAGNVTVTNVVVVHDHPVANTIVYTRATLAPGENFVFGGSYPAPTNCSVANTLNATATSRCGVGVSSVASATCPILTTPQILVTASCPTAPVTPGGSMVHSGTVRNVGDTTLNNIVVVRDFPAPNTTVFTLASLAPGASANFTSTLTVPANACFVTTTFSGRGTDVCAPVTVTNNVLVTCPITTAPAVVVTLTCPTTPAPTGGLITYTGTVRNSGNVILNNVTVVNNQSVPSTVLTVASLAPGVTTNFTASFTAPADACSVSSTVTVSGSDNCTGAVVNNSASATCNLTTTPRLVVTQTCPTGPSGLGGLLTYSGSVSNAGNITLTNVVVTNDRTGTTPVFTIATLAPGAIANFTGSYTVPLNAGCAITSTLTANGRDKCTGTQVAATAPATCPVQGAPNIAVRLACPATPTPLGALLTYSGSVSNSGNVTLTNIVVRRDVPAPTTIVFTVASLAPGASASFTGSYTVPSSNACEITTSVNATANDQCAGSGVFATVAISCPLVTTPAIRVTQTCPVEPVAPGGLVIYGGSVSNAGNITLTNITVVSSQPVPNTVVFNLASLAPGATAAFSGSFNSALDACAASSTLTASGQNQCNGNLTTNSVTTTCPLVTAPQISVTKSCPATPVIEGGLLVFTGTVTNTGNITLTNVMVVNNRPAANTTVLGPITLAPGAGTNFSGSYTAPLNTCSITDTLTASGRNKCTGSTVTNTATTTCPIITIPRIAVTLVCPATPATNGGLITYTGTVRNSGNVTLNNVTVVNVQSIPSTVLTVASLAPGVTTNFTTSFLAPPDSCSVSSTVTASASDACSGALVSTNATTICPLVSTPRIVVTQICPATPASPGGVLTYSGSVSNSGNITLTNVVVTNDRTGTTPVFSVATLAPGAILGFTGSYTVPTNSGCSVSSTLTAGGSSKCTGVRVTSTASATCPLLTSPRITVRQTCPTNLVAPGAVLTYTGTVSNSGNVTLTNVVVVNNQPASNTVIFTVATLAPGAIANFTGSYQVPTNCCVVSSTVGAIGRDNCTGAIVGDTFTATCTVLTVPKIVVTKVCPPTATRTGDLLQYSGVVSNAGNITLVNVTVVNSQSGSPVLGPITLAPRESVPYYAAYIVPPDFCGTDTVVAQGLDVCSLAPTTHSVTTTCSVVTAPRIVVTKNCPSTPTPRGGLLTFTGSVSNAGNVTLINVFVVNSQPSNNAPVIGPITLAPGATTNFIGSYIAPSCCCYVVDTLTARGQDRCSGSNVTATATAVCPLASTPGITVTKVCPQGTVPVGGLFTYSGTVSNTGDVVLTNVYVVSSQPSPNTPLLGPIELAPRETKSFSGSYTVTANSNPATDTVTASGTDTCQARTVTATANCSGSVGGPIVASVALNNGMVTVTWTATPGTVYALQYKTNLSDSSWLTVPGTVTANSNTASKNDAVGSTKQRLYRVVTSP